jgi:ATP-dependent Clp protease protease subunit
MEGYINFSAYINYNTTSRLKKVIDNFLSKGMSKLHLMLSTPGGKFFESISTYNFLKKLSVEIDVYIYNNCYTDSAGIMLYCAGKNRFAVPYASFLFHPGTYTVEDRTVFEGSKLREILNMVEEDDRKFIEIVSTTAGCGKDVVSNLIDQRVSLTAQKAKEMGLVTEISEYKISREAIIGGMYENIDGELSTVVFQSQNPDFT